MSDIQTIWQRFYNWIDNNMPVLRDSLGAGITDADIASAAEILQVELPDDLCQFYKIHNGQTESAETGLLLGLLIAQLDTIVEQWERWQEVLTEANAGEMLDGTSSPKGCIKSNFVNLKWIPVCHDYAGNHIGIDLDPGPQGKVGQVINFGRDERDKFVIADSYKDFLHLVLEFLESGNYRIDSEGLNLKEPPVSHFIDGLRQIHEQKSLLAKKPWQFWKK